VRDKMGEWMIGVEDQEALWTQLQDHDRYSGCLLISKYRGGCPFAFFVVDIDTNNGANIGVWPKNVLICQSWQILLLGKLKYNHLDIVPRNAKMKRLANVSRIGIHKVDFYGCNIL
jgi:hypothetical protein